MYESKFTAMKMPIIHIGTSGWHYKHWVGEFYPELEGHKSPLHLTSDFAYLRLHGPAGKYQGSYDDETLRKWLKKFGDWTENGIKEVYCYFDNDQKGYAAFNAKRMLELL
jgi:uncharacterized protein YecE (DUF72 family)